MERYVKQVRFILCCNYASQLIPAIQSRCTRFRFSPLSMAQMQARLTEIIQQEHLQVTAKAQTALLSLAGGDMRRVLNGLQACAAARLSPDAPIDEDLVYAVTAAPHPLDLQTILESCLSHDLPQCLEQIRRVQREKSLATVDIVRGLWERVDKVQMSPAMRIFLTCELAEMEARLGAGSVNDALQMASLAGIFYTARALQSA